MNCIVRYCGSFDIDYLFVETIQVQSLHEYAMRMDDLSQNDQFRRNLGRSENWTGSSLDDIIHALENFIQNLLKKKKFR